MYDNYTRIIKSCFK